MTGATSSAAGTHGLVPAPAAGKQTSFLRGDGTWVVPTNTDTKASLTLQTAANNYPLVFGTTQTSSTTATVTETLQRNNSIYVTPSTGTITATNFAGKVNGFTLGMDVPAGSKLTDTTYSDATTSAHGLMTAAMVTKLNGIQTGATATSITANLTSGTKIGTITINGTATDLYCQTNTHYTTHGILGASTTATSNATSATTNAATYLNIIDDSTVRNALKITGSGRTTVSANGGTLTISTPNYSNATTSAAGLMSAEDKAAIGNLAVSTGTAAITAAGTNSSSPTTVGTLNGHVYYNNSMVFCSLDLVMAKEESSVTITLTCGSHNIFNASTAEVVDTGYYFYSTNLMAGYNNGANETPLTVSAAVPYQVKSSGANTITISNTTDLIASDAVLHIKFMRAFTS